MNAISETAVARFRSKFPAAVPLAAPDAGPFFEAVAQLYLAVAGAAQLVQLESAARKVLQVGLGPEVMDIARARIHAAAAHLRDEGERRAQLELAEDLAQARAVGLARGALVQVDVELDLPLGGGELLRDARVLGVLAQLANSLEAKLERTGHGPVSRRPRRRLERRWTPVRLRPRDPG